MADTSYISAGQRVVGTISAAEDLVVVGRVEGRIQSEATVVVEASAIVEADIHARHVVVRGVVVGEVLGVEGIEVAASGQIFGDLKTRRLALRAGGRIAGLVVSGVEVQPYVYAGGKTTGVRQRVSTGAVPSRAPWPSTPSSPPSSSMSSPSSDEIVETSPMRSQSMSSMGGGQGESRKAKKEPSREAI